MFRKLLITSLFSIATMYAYAEQVTVFAAASMTNALQDIAQQYKQNSPKDEIVFSFASSSTLAKQIEEGAPANIFISAKATSHYFKIIIHTAGTKMRITYS